MAPSTAQEKETALKEEAKAALLQAKAKYKICQKRKAAPMESRRTRLEFESEVEQVTFESVNKVHKGELFFSDSHYRRVECANCDASISVRSAFIAEQLPSLESRAGKAKLCPGMRDLICKGCARSWPSSLVSAFAGYFGGAGELKIEPTRSQEDEYDPVFAVTPTEAFSPDSPE
eukprot:TRINITY_DN29824_c0_g1_i1.p1 TRINITY_DN29824_c0_g1~~TRINITY_DN29824_c0_g1_i1.p1  ORF type:complete len:192 (-),score=39.86 TRINITY_DN29824_c0_g1_i1:289-813(-)